MLILAGDVCATAIPVQGPLNTQVDLSAFQDNYCLDACVPNGAAGAEMFYRVRLDGSPGNLTVSAQPLDSVDVAIVMFASCDSCIAGTNKSGPGGVEVLSTPSLPNGDYTVCIKSMGPGPGGPVQVSFSATADAPTLQPTRLGFRRLNEHPARHDARMRFELVRASRVSLSIHDASGRTLGVLTLEPLGPGIHDRVWDLRDDRGRRVAPGVYYARLEVDTEVASLPIVVVR